VRLLVYCLDLEDLFAFGGWTKEVLFVGFDVLPHSFVAQGFELFSGKQHLEVIGVEINPASILRTGERGNLGYPRDF